jgi:hypothetical protein
MVIVIQDRNPATAGTHNFPFWKESRERVRDNNGDSTYALTFNNDC